MHDLAIINIASQMLQATGIKWVKHMYQCTAKQSNGTILRKKKKNIAESEYPEYKILNKTNAIMQLQN